MQAAVEAVTAVALAVAQRLAGLRPMIPLLAAVTVRVKMLFHVVSPLGTLKSQFRILW